jgi:tetratricopeptide (TPR) repeat protein
MAKKKRSERANPRHRRRPKAAPELPEDLPDRRTMERLLHQLTGSQADPSSPQGQAQELLAQAFEQGDPQKRVELARQALALWADCADAYVLLAEHAGSRKEALELYRQGVAAAERALGPDTFAQAAGHFWGILETRPYMRARQGLAHFLWTSGRREEAVEHLQDMLRLNPGDNQGVRYTLAGFLLFLDRDDDLGRLLDQYPDEGTAAWAYTRALLAFRRGGDTPEARKLLKAALKTNRHVPDYLLGRKFPPSRSPGYYSPGEESEALEYVGSFLAPWRSTPGAVAWLRANDPQAQKHKAKATQPRGPLPMVKNWLKKKLPQEPDTWQATVRQLPNPVEVAGDRVRLWVVLVASSTNALVLGHALLEEEPTAAAVWDVLVKAMQAPAAGEPHRPTELQVRADERWESLRPPLDEIGVRLTASEGQPGVDAMFAELSERVAGEAPPALLDMPGVGPDQVASFYAAAAAFFRQAPWKKVGYEAAIRVECDKFQGGPWYAVLMGQSGLTTGLALYDDLRLLRMGWEHPDEHEENARRSVATTVMFGDEVDVPLADVEAARRYGWEVARPDAWPFVMHKEQGLSHRPPLAWELELLEGCLRAVPELVSRRPQDDPTREELTVPGASGELKLVLSWVEEGRS